MGRLDSDGGAQSASHVVFPSLPFLQAAARISCLKLGGGGWEVSAATALCTHVTGPAPSPFPAGACSLVIPAGVVAFGLYGWPHLQAAA